MAGQKQEDQLEHTSSSYVRIRDVALKTCQRRWMASNNNEIWSIVTIYLIYAPLFLNWKLKTAWQKHNRKTWENLQQSKTRYTSVLMKLVHLPSFYTLKWLIGLVGRVFANGLEDLGSIQGRVIPKTLKMVLDTALLNTRQYKVRIKSKVNQSRERSSTPPTPRCSSAPPTPLCSSYWKGSLLVDLDYGRQLYFTTY